MNKFSNQRTLHRRCILVVSSGLLAVAGTAHAAPIGCTAGATLVTQTGCSKLVTANNLMSRQAFDTRVSSQISAKMVGAVASGRWSIDNVWTSYSDLVLLYDDIDRKFWSDAVSVPAPAQTQAAVVTAVSQPFSVQHVDVLDVVSRSVFVTATLGGAAAVGQSQETLVAALPFSGLVAPLTVLPAFTHVVQTSAMAVDEPPGLLLLAAGGVLLAARRRAVTNK